MKKNYLFILFLLFNMPALAFEKIALILSDNNALQNKLNKIGFTTTLVNSNISIIDFENTLQTFQKQINSNTIVLFYYSNKKEIINYTNHSFFTFRKGYYLSFNNTIKYSAEIPRKGYLIADLLKEFSNSKYTFIFLNQNYDSYFETFNYQNLYIFFNNSHDFEQRLSQYFVLYKKLNSEILQQIENTKIIPAISQDLCWVNCKTTTVPYANTVIGIIIFSIILFILRKIFFHNKPKDKIIIPKPTPTQSIKDPVPNHKVEQARQPIALMSAKSEAIIWKFTFQQKAQLIDRLLQCPSLQTNDKINIILRQMDNQAMVATISYASTTKIYLINIIDTITTFKGGLENFMEVLYHFEAGSLKIIQVIELLDTIKGEIS